MGNMRSWMTKDVANFEECFLDEMLKDFLVDSTGEAQELFDDTHRTRLFEKCLEKVLPICNGESMAKDKDTDDIKPSFSKVKENLAEYSEAHGTHEDELCPLFVTVTNVALLYLQELEVNDLRPLRDDIPSVSFHVDHQYHQCKLSERNPDVVVVSRSDAHNADGLEQPLFTIPTKAPKKQLDWRSIYSFVEFERSTKTEAPPAWYTLEENAPPPRVDVSNDGSEPHVIPTRPPPPEPVGRSAHQQENAVGITNSGSHERVQAGHYAADMFAAYVGRQHVIGLIVVGNVLYIRRYDRQGTIQCYGLNFIQDLPRFLVLLLAIQRFETKHWGLNPHVDTQFGPRPPSQKTTLHGDEGNKVFWMKITCMDEPEILKKAYRITEADPDVKGHTPEILQYETLNDTSGKIRVLFCLKTRTLRPITELYGDEFLNAWWVTVQRHYTLWRNGAFLRDISASNLMYYRDKQGNITAVFSEFDLESTHETATGRQCTGTALFMAVRLLDEVMVGGMITGSYYEHAAESLVWVLVWISLRYANGKLRDNSDRPLNAWVTASPAWSRMKKHAFVDDLEMRGRLQAGTGHQQNWRLAQDCIEVLRQSRKDENNAPLDIDTVFEKLLRVPTGRYLK